MQPAQLAGQYFRVDMLNNLTLKMRQTLVTACDTSSDLLNVVSGQITYYG